MCDFVLQKKRGSTNIPRKLAVTFIGKQNNGQWTLTKDVTVDDNGELVSPDDSPYCWISSLLPKNCDNNLSIPLPLSTNPLPRLVHQLEIIMSHNIYPTLMLMGAAAMSLHYQTILSKYQSCPIPIAFGPSGTGKTTALRCALSIIGAHPHRFYSRATLEKLLDISSKSSFPIGIDDPSFQKHIDNLCIDLFNGARSGNVSRGLTIPKSTAIITANFSTSSKAK